MAYPPLTEKEIKREKEIKDYIVKYKIKAPLIASYCAYNTKKLSDLLGGDKRYRIREEQHNEILKGLNSYLKAQQNDLLELF